MNFGHLEFLVTTYLEKRLPREASAAIREKHFKDRIEKVKAVFATTDERRGAFARFEEKLTPVRELRNHIAHGFLQIVLRPGETEPVVGITMSKEANSSFSTDTKHVTFAELREHLTALSEVIKEFQDMTDNEAGWSEPVSTTIDDLATHIRPAR